VAFSVRTVKLLKYVLNNLAKGRIVVLPHLAAANAFVLRVRWAGTFARGGRRTMRMSPSKCPFRGGFGVTPSNTWFLGLTCVSALNGISIGSRSDRHTDTDHATCDICALRAGAAAKNELL